MFSTRLIWGLASQTARRSFVNGANILRVGFSRRLCKQAPSEESQDVLTNESSKGFLERLCEKVNSYGWQINKEKVKKYTTIILAVYFSISMALLITVYNILWCDNLSRMGRFVSQFETYNRIREEESKKLFNLLDRFKNHWISKLFPGDSIYTFSKVFIAFGFYKLLSIPKLMIFTCVLAFIFRKKKSIVKYPK
ncbi:hypothetical protein RF11_13841 [Thelohanellus kitauei]|uniref:Uncharacterized protein n=1 Tax=Thelohanellus kitauei TaxID=669202 RepID=A0A0C2M5X8_THEKT|nr:hypothetical protein RF11_13841 [Thelohanellus kitauei]